MPRRERTYFPFPMTVAYAAIVSIALLAFARAGLSAIGVDPPPRPGDATLLNMYAFLVPGQALLAGAVALLARGMSGGFLSRFLSLSAFAWFASSMNVTLGMSAVAADPWFAPAYTTAYACALAYVPSLAIGAISAATFVPGGARPAFTRRAHAWLASGRSAASGRAATGAHRSWSWTWRLPLGIALTATFLMLVSLFLAPVVDGSAAGHVARLQLLRGVFMAATVAPIVILWERPAAQLIATLAGAWSIPTAAMAWVLGSHIPDRLRFAGVVELLVASTIVAAMLVGLWLGRHADVEIDAMNDAEIDEGPRTAVTAAQGF